MTFGIRPMVGDGRFCWGCEMGDMPLGQRGLDFPTHHPTFGGILGGSYHA